MGFIRTIHKQRAPYNNKAVIYKLPLRGKSVLNSEARLTDDGFLLAKTKSIEEGTLSGFIS